MIRYCVDCGIEHLVKDCPKKSQNPQQSGKTVLNYIEPIIETESEGRVSLRVITRAQKKKQNKGIIPNETITKPKKRQRKKWVKEKSPDEKVTEQMPEQTQQGKHEQQPSKEEILKTSSGGSVLMEKVNDNVEAMLKAFVARIKPATILPKELQE